MSRDLSLRDSGLGALGRRAGASGIRVRPPKAPHPRYAKWPGEGRDQNKCTPQGPPNPPDASGGDPVDAACAEPDGGWTSPDLSKAGDADVRDLMRAMKDEPDFAGLWIDYVAEPVDEGAVEPGGIIANVAFTGDLGRHTAQIRERWGGPLCVVQRERTYTELRGIQRELGDGAASELGLEMTWSSVDIQGNVVELGVVVADEAARAAVDARYGVGSVELQPHLEPVS